MHRSQGGDHYELLGDFFDRGLITEVLGLVKTGKEASVYCCLPGSGLDFDVELVAAKVYRARQYRFKNDAIYQESRARELGLRGSALRAFDKRRKSDTGRAVQNATWINHEFSTLSDLYEAGADVPQPYAGAENAILMEYLGDETNAAPQLNRVRLEDDIAPYVFQRLLDNIELWLSQNRVHGDLSPHNILYWQGRVSVIDFPQSVDPRFNSHARDLLLRDIANVCRYFGTYGIEPDPEVIAHDLWRRFTFGEL